MKKELMIFMMLLLTVAIYGQQDSQFTQYMYNTIDINPAYAGSRGQMSIFGLYRAQWVGLEGAPKTNSFSVNAPLNNSRVGLGVSFLNDKIGPTVENTISADISYTIPAFETFDLSFGIKSSANLFSFDASKLNPEDQNDLALQNYKNKFTPNIGAGLYLYSDKAYVGISIPYIIETNRYNDNEIAIYKEKMHYYLIAGYVFDLSSELKFKPAALAKIVEGAPLQVDLSGNFLINDKFTIGLAYRWSAALSAMAGFQVADFMFVGYGYDRETTSLEKYNSGSHEIFLRFEILNRNKSVISPRFF
jgi:type IX secretion system PorP/SprF family membrane protein